MTYRAGRGGGGESGVGRQGLWRTLKEKKKKRDWARLYPALSHTHTAHTRFTGAHSSGGVGGAGGPRSSGACSFRKCNPAKKGALLPDPRRRRRPAQPAPSTPPSRPATHTSRADVNIYAGQRLSAAASACRRAQRARVVGRGRCCNCEAGGGTAAAAARVWQQSVEPTRGVGGRAVGGTSLWGGRRACGERALLHNELRLFSPSPFPPPPPPERDSHPPPMSCPLIAALLAVMVAVRGREQGGGKDNIAPWLEACGGDNTPVFPLSPQTGQLARGADRWLWEWKGGEEMAGSTASLAHASVFWLAPRPRPYQIITPPTFYTPPPPPPFPIISSPPPNPSSSPSWPPSKTWPPPRSRPPRRP